MSVCPSIWNYSAPTGRIIWVFHILIVFLKSSSSSSVICQTTGPEPLPKRFLHIVRSRASSFNWQYPLLSLRSSISFLRLLPRLLVTSICPFIFPSITCCRRQFLRKMWPIQLAFRYLISCRISDNGKKNRTSYFFIPYSYHHCYYHQITIWCHSLSECTHSHLSIHVQASNSCPHISFFTQTS